MTCKHPEYANVWDTIVETDKFVIELTTPSEEATRQARALALRLSSEFLALRPVPSQGCPYVSEVCKGLNNLCADNFAKFNLELTVLDSDVGDLMSWFSVFAGVM